MSDCLIGKLGLVIGLAWSGILPAEDGFSLGSFVDASSGDYGANSATEVIANVLQGKYVHEDFTVQLDLSYLQVSGSGTATAVLDNALFVTSGSVTRHSEGIGDTQLSLIYNAYYDPDSSVAIDLGFKLKIPTASRVKGLGSGEVDEALQVFAYKSLGDVLLLLGAGYKWYGQPDDISYCNIASASTGVVYQWTPQSSLGVLFDFKQSIFTDMPDQYEMTLYAAHRLSSDWRMQLYLYGGATDSSPNIGGGGSLTYQF